MSDINSFFEIDYEQALTLTGFGWFHYRLLALCGLIYANTAIGITVMSFVLPSATCDFRMSPNWLPCVGAEQFLLRFWQVFTNSATIRHLSVEFSVVLLVAANANAQSWINHHFFPFIKGAL